MTSRVFVIIEFAVWSVCTLVGGCTKNILLVVMFMRPPLWSTSEWAEMYCVSCEVRNEFIYVTSCTRPRVAVANSWSIRSRRLPMSEAEPISTSEFAICIWRHIFYAMRELYISHPSAVDDGAQAVEMVPSNARQMRLMSQCLWVDNIFLRLSHNHSLTFPFSRFTNGP
jgi:hypothetical protein